MKDLGAYFELSVVTHGTLWYPEMYLWASRSVDEG
jgi:hypothetical protein